MTKKANVLGLVVLIMFLCMLLPSSADEYKKIESVIDRSSTFNGSSSSKTIIETEETVTVETQTTNTDTRKLVKPKIEDNKKTEENTKKEEQKEVKEATNKDELFEKPNYDDLKKYNTAILKTDYGDIKINLFTKDAPITVSNFIDLSTRKIYDGTVFHRVVKDFVIQGGDPTGTGSGNFVDPYTGRTRFVKLETSSDLRFDRPGRVGLARSGSPNSGSCQFFIALKSEPFLDPGGADPYGSAVFGQVTDDTIETVFNIVKSSKPKQNNPEWAENPTKIKEVILLAE